MPKFTNKELLFWFFVTSLSFYFLGVWVTENKRNAQWAAIARKLNEMECSCLHPERGLQKKEEKK